MIRKILFISILSVFSISVFGQNFPKDKVDLFIGKKVKPKEIDEVLRKYSYKNFYVDFDDKTKEFSKKKPFPSGPSYSQVSEYSKMVGKEFLVTEFYKIPPKYDFSSIEYALKLENEDIGTIYYKYSPKYESSLELEVVGGLDLPDNFYCEEIKTEKDKFTGEVTSRTPFSSGINFIKITKEGVTNIYMFIREIGETPNVGKKGLFLIFENSEKIERPEADIDVEVSKTGKYIYSAFIRLEPNEIELLKNQNITDDRLYIYDGSVDKESAREIRAYLKCLLVE